MAPKYPAIPDPTTDPNSLRDATLALKQGFEILTGQRGDGSAAAVVGSSSLAGALLAANNLSDVASAEASWRNLGGLDLSSVISLTTTSTLNTTAFGRLHFITGSASFTTTIPTPVGNAGKVIAFIVGDAANATKLFTLTSPAGVIGRSGSSIVMWANESVLLRSNGVDWQVLQSKQIPFTGQFFRTTDLASGASYTEVVFTSAANDSTGLNLAFDAVNGRFVSPRSSNWIINAYVYLTQAGSPTYAQAAIADSTNSPLGGVFSFTGSLTGATIYGVSMVRINGGSQMRIIARADGTSPTIKSSLVAARVDYAEVCPGW